MPDREIPEAVVVVTEALDGTAVPRWERLISEAMALRPRRLVVDLRHSPQADAAGIGVLLRAHRAMISAGGQLVLRAPADRVRRVLRLARLDGVFEIEELHRQA
ncbi:STAS domain-containing protein [Actinoplanes sp. NPDC026619]|uniref:STAS domain-containing protein n=1 Tax=Actinoplanes sp. NPDC026619 TaxID=3155798 RepID=UPI0033F6B009